MLMMIVTMSMMRLTDGREEYDDGDDDNDEK